MEKFDQKIKEKLQSYPSIESPSDSEVSKMMNMLDKAMPNASRVFPIHSKPKFKASIYFKIAASLILFLAALFTAYQLAEVRVESGESALVTVELPDNSVITLKNNSKVSYNRLVWMFNRTLAFSGEGYFEVEKGEKFSVHSDLGFTQVIGTSFTIYSSDDNYEVACFSGKVSVASNMSSQQIVLRPGDAVTLNSAGFDPYKLQNLAKPVWVSGEFHFEDEDFIHVIKTLENQYQVEVTFPEEYENLKYTGYFDKTDLKKALKLVCEPFELRYEIKGKTILLKP